MILNTWNKNPYPMNLIQKNIGNVISLKNTEPNYFSMQSINKLQSPPKEKIDNKNIVNIINEFLN